MQFTKKNFLILLQKVKDFENVLKTLQLENIELKRQLNQNSNNSHRPPSTDIYKPNPKPAFLVEEKDKKKLGGQIGHIGKTLEMVAFPNKYFLIPPKTCACCGKVLKGCKIEKTGKKRQVVDIPKIVNSEVIEYEVGYAVCCGVKHYGKFPKNLKATTQYGNYIKAFVVYLSVHNNLSVEKIVSLLKTTFNVTMNGGTVCNILHDTKIKLGHQLEEIKLLLAKRNLVHLDETSINIKGKNQWVHNVSTKNLTYQYVDESRGAKAHKTKGGYQPTAGQIIVHDCWKMYFTEYRDNPHVLCNAHIIRELRSVIENDCRKWAIDMLAFMYDLYNKTKNGIITLETKQEWVKQYKSICKRANKEEPINVKSGRQGKTKQTKGRNLLIRLIQEQEAILRFAFEKNIPFTNNQAEREMRSIKVKLKMATHFRSVVGAQAFIGIKSFLSSVSKNGLNLLESLFTILENPKHSFNFSSG